MVEAIYRSLLHKKSKGKIFNLGTGKPLKIKFIIELIRKLSKASLDMEKLKLRKDEIKYLFHQLKR